MSEEKATYEKNQIEMPKYKSHKSVWALKIKEISFDSDLAKKENRETTGCATITPEEKGYVPFEVNCQYVHKHKPEVGGYFVQYKDGYQSFSPAKAFEEGYTLIDGIKPSVTISHDLLKSGKGTFGDAIQALKGGLKVSRKGWNGANMYLWWIEGAKQSKPENEILPCICMRTVDYKTQPGWLASQSDILAEDWMLVE